MSMISNCLVTKITFRNNANVNVINKQKIHKPSSKLITVISHKISCK